MQKSLTKCLSLSLEGHISLWRTRRETLFWMVLNKAGNSNAEERTDLMAKLNNVFPDQPIATLSGDREFIGERWMRWLHERGIPFVLRLKENMFIWKEGYVPVKLSAHAGHLEKRRKHILKGTWYLGRDPENGQRRLRLP